jgi:hypothetical protein
MNFESSTELKVIGSKFGNMQKSVTPICEENWLPFGNLKKFRFIIQQQLTVPFNRHRLYSQCPMTAIMLPG